MASLNFNAVLLDISNNLSAEQLDELTFMCKDVVGKREREKINTGLKLFQILTERGHLGPQNSDFLSRILTEIHRQDLCDKLNNCVTEFSNNQPDKAERAKLDIAMEVVVETIGTPWRKLGRKLGLSEVKLDSIAKRHPTDLEETVVELLKEWVKIQNAEATVKKLIEALRACQFNMTADKVEDRLA